MENILKSLKKLKKQLAEKGYPQKDYPYLYDQLRYYASLCMIKEALLNDIETRGVTVEWHNSETSKGVKQNDSIITLLKVDNQILKTLTFLGLKPSDIKLEEDDSDVEL